MDHYRLANAFALPGRGEGFGIVYLEAMACGLPVVASTADASQEIIRHCGCGEIVNPGDPADLRRGLIAALNARHIPTAENLRTFSWDAFRDRVAELVNQETGDAKMLKSEDGAAAVR